LTGLEFLPENRPDFWEKAGYHNEEAIWEEKHIRCQVLNNRIVKNLLELYKLREVN